MCLYDSVRMLIRHLVVKKEANGKFELNIRSWVSPVYG